MDNVVIDWAVVEEHLDEIEELYFSIGPAGHAALDLVISPLRERFYSGERTLELCNAITELE